MKPTRQPQILTIQPGNENAVVRQTVKALKKGALVILPTDTVYGIAADSSVPGAEDRLFEAKNRKRNKPVPLLAASITDVKEYGACFNDLERKLAEQFWPGPLTLVLEVRDLETEHRSEGFRIPDCAITQAVLKEAGGILRVTSANKSNEPPALIAEDAMRALGDFTDVVIDAGPVPGGTPSTVIKVHGEEIVVLREGAIGKSRLSAASYE
ncbi:L-threonylcarbamoyladenylate synthase [Verrucomicrobiota bacterium]